MEKMYSFRKAQPQNKFYTDICSHKLRSTEFICFKRKIYTLNRLSDCYNLSNLTQIISYMKVKHCITISCTFTGQTGQDMQPIEKNYTLIRNQTQVITN